MQEVHRVVFPTSVYLRLGTPQRGGNQGKRTIRFQLDGETYQVEVERSGNRLTVSRAGEYFTVSLLEGPPQPAAKAGGDAAERVQSANPAPATPWSPRRRCC